MSKSEDALKEALPENHRRTVNIWPLPLKLIRRDSRQAARLFRAAAEAETVHAHAHLAGLKRNQIHKGKPARSDSRRNS